MERVRLEEFGAGGRVLVVDDDPAVANALCRGLRRHGFETEWAESGASARQALAAAYFNVLLLDVHLPDVDGWELLDHARGLADPPLCFVLSGRADLRTAVEAMKRGAIDYFEKPFDLGDLVLRMQRGLHHSVLDRRLRAYERTERTSYTPVAASSAMRNIFALADKVAASPNSSALILGESGVGKEVIATRIHERSARRNAPFVRVNLAAIPDSMVEAELFGSVRGAFTDAKRDRAGFFSSADGGTILLDELCEFKMESQSKLLRVLEQRVFYPVGSDRSRSVNVRILAATNREPQEAIRSGLLRADLYYRLGTVTIRIPPLRQRRDEIIPLAETFLIHFCAEFGKPICTLTDGARQLLVTYEWPGNVRELRNTIERAVMLCDGTTIGEDVLGIDLARRPSGQWSAGGYESPELIEVPPIDFTRLPGRIEHDGHRLGHLAGGTPSPDEVYRRVPRNTPPIESVMRPTESPTTSRSQDFPRTEPVTEEPPRSAMPSSTAPHPESYRLDEARQAALEHVEREHILRVLKLAGGSRTRAADMLGVSRSTLWEKVKRYGIE